MTDLTTPEITCKNCNHTFTKQYCNGCGQKKAERITVSHLMHDVVHAVLHADKGIFPYIKRLLLAPGALAKDYIAGKRKTFNPMQFLMLSIGFVILLMTLTGFYEKVEVLQAQTAAAGQLEMQAKLNGFNTFVKKNGTIIVFFLLPIFAFFSKLLFNKQNNNYAEHLMLSVFTMSASNVLTAVMLVVYHFLGIGIMPIMISTLCLTILCFFVIYNQFYQLSWLAVLWRSVVVYLLTMIVYMFTSMIIAIFILIFA